MSARQGVFQAHHAPPRGVGSRICSSRAHGRCPAPRPLAPAVHTSARPTGRASLRASSSSSSSSSSTAITYSGSSSELDTLQRFPVYPAGGGAPLSLASLWPSEQPFSRAVIVFLTHFADLSSTELAQKLLPVLPQLDAAGVRLVAVGLGDPDKAARFAELVGFPAERLYATPSTDLYRALGFNPGFLPESKLSAYAKLLAMLAGLGSPGTIPEVLRGYAGDRSAPPVFTPRSGGSGGTGSGGRSLFDVLGPGYQRPFELATLRLLNMQLVLTHWSELAPADDACLTQQGGCLGFAGRTLAFKHVDRGILTTVDPRALLAAMAPGSAQPETQVLRSLI